MTIVIDETHLGRRASGIERVTRALFSRSALAPLDVTAEQSENGKVGLVLRQTFGLPAKAAAHPGSVWVFPGFPPSPAFGLLRHRSVLYVHDVFLITRRQDLNGAARYWLSPNFRFALRRFKYFMANSQATANALRPFVGDRSRILIYRPAAENVFGLTSQHQISQRDKQRPLIVGAIGTVEPRKNFPAAAEICARLASLLGRPVELHIIGRNGWGADHEHLAGMPHVRLHGFLSDDAARNVIGSFDVLICTSHDEGLGLPLLEAQFAGMQVVAPDRPVFREVLGASGVFIDPGAPAKAAGTIAASMRREDWRDEAAIRAASNIERWNKEAVADRAEVVTFLADLESKAA